MVVKGHFDLLNIRNIVILVPYRNFNLFELKKKSAQLTGLPKGTSVQCATYLVGWAIGFHGHPVAKVEGKLEFLEETQVRQVEFEPTHM